MKRLGIIMLGLVAAASACAQSKVYMTRDISPESLVKIYKAIGKPADGHKVAVKISTGKPAIPIISSLR